MTDENLFRSMVKSINLFEGGSITIKALLSDLKNIYWNLSERPEDFSELYFTNWGFIEEIYAIHLAKGRTMIEGEEEEKIREAASALKIGIQRRYGH